MNRLERFVYASGRALGAGAREFLDTMHPPTDPQVAEATRSDAWKTATTHEVGTPDYHVHKQSQAPNLRLEPHSMDDALAGVDDEFDWFDWARPEIAEVLDAGQWVPPEWLDTVSAIIAEKIAANSPKAIAALWNTELRRQETE